VRNIRAPREIASDFRDSAPATIPTLATAPMRPNVESKKEENDATRNKQNGIVGRWRRITGNSENHSSPKCRMRQEAD
jgi:hypothetical protein